MFLRSQNLRFPHRNISWFQFLNDGPSQLAVLSGVKRRPFLSISLSTERPPSPQEVSRFVAILGVHRLPAQKILSDGEILWKQPNAKTFPNYLRLSLVLALILLGSQLLLRKQIGAEQAKERMAESRVRLMEKGLQKSGAAEKIKAHLSDAADLGLRIESATVSAQTMRLTGRLAPEKSVEFVAKMSQLNARGLAKNLPTIKNLSDGSFLCELELDYAP